MTERLVTLMRLRIYIADKRGMSLVEVLAALAVFVVGILAVVRMFPPGFMVVKQSENVTMANRLAQAELERLKGTVNNLPAGILGWNIVNNRVLIDMNPENMGELPRLGMMSTPPNPYYYSDVNKFRRIFAESTKIPAPMHLPLWSADPTDLISMYVLNLNPIEWSGPTSVTIRSGPMRRRGVPEEGREIRSSSDYAIDYDAAAVHVRKLPYPREYVISYSYWAQGSGHPELRPVLSARIIVPANQTKVDIPNGHPTSPTPVRSEAGFMFIDNGSDSLHRSFDLIPSGNDWNPDNPYQYKVLDNVRGVIGFNPAGYGYQEMTAWGRVALTAYIDYDVLDWHIIREERKIPEAQFINSDSDADLSIKLTLRYIKNAGLPSAAPPVLTATTEFDGSTYTGLSSSLLFSILAIDIQTGEWFYEGSLLPSGDHVMVVNYKDGIIKFHPDMAGRTFRIYYRAEGDWALQVFKTYESYRRSYNFRAGSQAPLDHREWYGSTANASDGTPYFTSVIHFARCYHGMSVALDYTYRIPVSGGKYNYYNVDGDTYQTDVKLGITATCAIDPRARIARLRGVGIDDVEIIRITKVYGVSVGARVIWRDGSRGFDAGQWKKIDLQTYLMRLQD